MGNAAEDRERAIDDILAQTRDPRVIANAGSRLTYRNRRLLDLAHTCPCFANFQHQCFGHQGCDPAHSDSSIFGRGHGHKSHDFAFASMCNTAHRMLDAMTREEKFYAWMRAYVATQEYLWENGLLRIT